MSSAILGPDPDWRLAVRFHSTVRQASPSFGTKELNAPLPKHPHMDTDRTRLKVSQCNLPVAASSSNMPEAYRRAPTLMAGAASGGQVQIWAPSKRHLRVWCGFWGLLLALNLCLAVLDGLMGHWLRAFEPLTQAILPTAMLAGFWTLIRRPRYAATDASGIAITTKSGSVAVSWADVLHVRCSAENLTILGRGDSSPRDGIVLNLKGYPKPAREALVQLIANQAGLTYHAKEYYKQADTVQPSFDLASTQIHALPDPSPGPRP